MSSYGLIVMILAFCVGGVMELTLEMREFESHLKQIFCSIIFSNMHCIVKVTNTELRDINRQIGCRDA